MTLNPVYTKNRTPPIRSNNKKGLHIAALFYCWRKPLEHYSTAFTMSSTTFLASPKTIMVLSM
jgi:hypothetical protein